MRYLKYISLLALVALLHAGCNDPLTSPNDTSVIMPLAIGNRWIGRVTTYAPDGGVLQVGQDTISIGRQEFLDEFWYIDNRNIAFINRTDGLWSWDGGPGVVGRPYLLARYPAAVGDTFGVMRYRWKSPSGSTLDTLLAVSTVASLSFRAIVPFGTFDTYRYNTELRHLDGQPFTDQSLAVLKDYRCYAPGIGPVLEETHTRAADGTIYVSRRWELVSMLPV